MIHCYCILPAGCTPDADAEGVDSARVCAIDVGDLALWASHHDAAPAADMTALRAHNAVIARAMLMATPVPLRYGQTFLNEQTARAGIMTSHEKWLGLLRRFEGCEEYGIRVFDPRPASVGEADQPEPAAGRGTAYMTALRARLRGPDRARTEVEAGLGEATELAADVRTEGLATEHGVLSMAHLVHRSRADAYRTAIERGRAKLPHYRLLVTGPWPPYSFVE